MAFVTDTIQFLSGPSTAPSLFATNANKVRDLILASGMVQVSQSDWPGQMGDVVTGTATGQDVSLDDITFTSGNNVVGFWVFKHPTLALYTKLTYSLLSQNQTTPVPNVPRFYFEHGHDINVGAGEFFGSVVVNPGLRTWHVSRLTDSAYFPAATFSMYAYCGESGFWIYSDGGVIPYDNSGSNYMRPHPKYLSLLAAVALCSTDDPARWISVAQPITGAGSTIGCQINYDPSRPLGSATFANRSGVWVNGLPGDFGDLVNPNNPMTDIGMRVAQAHLYGAGAPLALPLGMIQATVTEGTIIRLDLDGSGERDFLPATALHPVRYRGEDVPLEQFPTGHAFYLLPASDN